MKKTIILPFLVTFLLVAWTSQTSAQECGKKKATTEVAKAEKNKTAYQCPMKCEGDKTYDKPGKCPKCGMDLKKTDTQAKVDKKTNCEKAKKADKNAVAYQCPMKCEGDKTYDKPGKCPKCGMELKKMEKKGEMPPMKEKPLQ